MSYMSRSDVKMEDVRTRVRRRRRRIAILRRENAGNNSSRFRLPIIVITLCLITAMAGYMMAYAGDSGDTGLSYSAQAEVETIYKTVTVRSGDTLWGIASSYSDPSRDVRTLVKEICDLNDVKPGNIYPGQSIIVPIPAHLL